MNKGIDRKSTIQEKYNWLLPEYRRLTDNLHKALIQFLGEAGIETLNVEKRVKDFDSLWGKVEAKKYENPLEDAEDICGVRIVNYYPSDLDAISELIGKEFVVHEAVDKLDLLEDDRFGYRSYHFIVTLKPEWLKVPPYCGLENIKAEIQVRTILMHAWAAISHKLSYKKDEDIPTQFKRTLYSLSALIELADNQFDVLRSQREEYRESLVSTEAGGKKAFDASQPLTVDSLQSFLDFHCPEKDRNADDIPGMIDIMRENNISLEQLDEGFSRFGMLLEDIEEDYAKAYFEAKGSEKEVRWNQKGAATVIAALISRSYWESLQGLEDFAVELFEKWRKSVSTT